MVELSAFAGCHNRSSIRHDTSVFDVRPTLEETAS
jgi:hypothetical protein